MTFLGFRLDPDGNLLDPQTDEIIQERLISRRLRTGLHVQGVDLDKDIESYSKYVSKTHNLEKNKSIIASLFRAVFN